MDQHSAVDGFVGSWHMVHLGSRAVGGAGLVMAESTAVRPDGRISYGDVGMWSDDHVAAWQDITDFISSQGAIPAMQLSHAGRKGSIQKPWEEARKPLPHERGGWETVGPSPIAFGDLPSPRVLDVPEILEMVGLYRDAAIRAVRAGFKVIEIHAAHGYLLHQFLSPLSNAREDSYGGSFENRTRFLREVVASVRSVIPEDMPLFVRVSATDWVQGGWDLPQTIALAKELKTIGVDLIDVSSGGARENVKIPVAPGYQVALARQIREEAGILTAAVGLITTPAEAQAALDADDADAIMLGRALLNDPYWARHAAQELRLDHRHVRVKQYARAEPIPRGGIIDPLTWQRVQGYEDTLPPQTSAAGKQPALL